MKYFAFILTAAILISCGKSIDKNTLEGRVASFVSLQEGVYMAVSMDLKNIIEKSGIKDGAIPEQYLSTITPYLDALYKSINLEKQVYMMPNVNTSNLEKSDFVLMFEVGDLNTLKKEIKEFGVNLKKKGDLEYGLKGQFAFGVYKGETAFFVFKDNGTIEEKDLIAYGQNMSEGKTIDGVVDFVTQKSDIVAYYTGDKMSNVNFGDFAPELKEMSAKMTKLYEGTYWIAHVDFQDQEAIMEMSINMGKNLKKYAPFLASSLTEDSKSIVVSENTIMAFAMHANMDKIIAMILDQMDDKTKDEVNKQLALLGGTEKFKQLLSGEFAFAMVAKEEPIFTAFVGVGDQKQVKSLLDGFGFFLGLKKKGDIYEMDDAQLMFNEKGLLYAANAELMGQIKAKKSAKIRDMAGFKFGASPISMFVDFKAMSKLKDIEEFNLVYNVFDFMYFEMNEKGGKGRIKSVKSNQNILRTLVEAALELQRLDELRQAELEAQYEEWSDEEWEDFYGSADWDATW
jgi:hypothetical protein